MNGGIGAQSRFDWPKQVHFPQQCRQTTTICWPVAGVTGASAVYLCVSACVCLRACFVHRGRDTSGLEWQRQNHLSAGKIIRREKKTLSGRMWMWVQARQGSFLLLYSNQISEISPACAQIFPFTCCTLASTGTGICNTFIDLADALRRTKVLSGLFCLVGVRSRVLQHV